MACRRRSRCFCLAASSLRRSAPRRRSSLSKASAALRAALSSIFRRRRFLGFPRDRFGPRLGSSSDRCVGRSACSLKAPSEPTGRLRTTLVWPGSQRRRRDRRFPSPGPDGRDCCRCPTLPRPPSSMAPLSPDQRTNDASKVLSFLAMQPPSAAFKSVSRFGTAQRVGRSKFRIRFQGVEEHAGANTRRRGGSVIRETKFKGVRREKKAG
jgi:hypothetical protein